MNYFGVGAKMLRKMMKDKNVDTLEDMIANREFWKYLGEEYGADVIVSGVMKGVSRAMITSPPH